MATILGPDGRPVNLTRLKEEQAAPTLTGVRQVISDHPAQGLTPGRLAALLLESEQGDATRYLELAEEMEEKDLHYRSVLSTRKQSVAALEITVEPASDSAEDKANAELVETFTNRDELRDELLDILDAVGKGYSATEIIWDTSEREWMPQRLEWRFPQWFEFDREDGRKLLLREMGGPVPLDPFKFVCHIHKSKSGLPIRGGLARAAAWSYLFKNYDLKDWIAFIEIYGQPIRVGKYHSGATEDDKEKLLKAVANIGSDAAAVIPESMMIEFIKSDSARETGALYKDFADYVDAQISKAVLGQTLTTEVKSGSLAAAQVHDNVRHDIEAADCRQLEATLNRDIGRPIVELNRGPQKALPRITIGRPEQVDVAQLTDSVAKLVPVGLRVSESEVRRKIGLGEPDDESDILRAPAPPAGPVPPGQGGPQAAIELGAQCPGCGHVVSAVDRAPRDPADDLTDISDKRLAKVHTAFIDQLRNVVGSARSMDEVAVALLSAYPGLEEKDLADSLRLALVVAELAGRSDIIDRT